MLSEQEINEIRSQLLEQVASLPPEKREAAEKQVNSLSPEALEALLDEQKSTKSGKQKTIYRMIIDKEVPSTIIAETKKALAVLDINPLSQGHVMIIPKLPVSDSKKIPVSLFSLAKKIATKITKNLKAKSTEIQTENKFGESIINIIPSYNSPITINSPRKKASKEELDKVAEKIRIQERKKVHKVKTTKTVSSPDSVIRMHKRIP